MKLTPLPGDVPGEVRVRRALKLLLRVFRIRATWPEPTIPLEKSKPIQPESL